MQEKAFIFILTITLLLISTHAITKYDFNVCRIKFCADKQASCVSDEDSCMEAFAKTRQCFATCLTSEQLETYNKCWTICKQANAYNSNSLYNAVGVCYEQNCYLGETRIYLIFLLCLIIYLVLW